MDNSRPFPSTPRLMPSFPGRSESATVSTNRGSSVTTTTLLPDSGPSQSQSISSNFSANPRGAYHGLRGQHQPPASPLDAFDKELLAAEPNEDRRWQASQGLARLSLPPKSVVNPKIPGITRDWLREELHATPQLRYTSSSSPCEALSSPTIMALSQRQNHPRSFILNRPCGQDQSSPLPGNDAAALAVPFQNGSQRSAPSTPIPLSHAPPVVQGIPLVSVNGLPDRLRSLFNFPLFNAVQSKCFDAAFKSDQNLVLSAPTGSGKTVIMELAICHLMHSDRAEEFKIVYLAPTKALCSERCLDWRARFGSLDLQCAELTGDTDTHQTRNVQAANIIITTPEKWDSITRRWKDHAKLMRLVKLFLIDEVHILKESRGATLEAVVSRMKSTGSGVRFVALSATVPNSEDVAIWLGKDPYNPALPAHREVFGEEFRPVRLQKVVYGYPVKSNDFVFDSILEAKLPEIIAKHSQGKPIIIFCPFRKSCVKTAKSLAQLWTSTTPSDRLWCGPSRPPPVLDHDLRQLLPAGVAFHHAGLDVSDRRAVEQAFLSHTISIICCTSTLAVGVNLPCYLVIIKGTVAWTDNGCQEYADLEMMQMLGRAGRPQFDQSSCGVILTRNERVDYYDRLVSGQEPLESCLHLNLIEHLNAEIALGTVCDLGSARRWLASTFLFVRLSRNMSYYRLKEDVTSRDDEELLGKICSRDVALLHEADLVSIEPKLRCTEFGDAMARYYIKFDTMKVLLMLAPKAKISEILSAIAQAAEYRDIRLKSGEKSLYKHLNKDLGIKFPIKVDIALSAHKVSLLLQAELGGLDFPVGEQFAKHRNQYQQDKAVVFQHVNRLVRCIIDCQLTRGDSVAARHALELARSFAARVWDNSPLQLKQLDQIGNAAVRKLANAGINSIESLENAEAHRIEAVIGRGPPFGMKLLSRLAQFPKLRVSVRMAGKEIKPERCIRIRLRVEIGFLNEKVPVFFRKKPVYTCFLAETSDGQIIDFRRMAASQLQNGHEVLLTAELTKVSQYVSCYVMCDEIAGTCRSAEIRANFPASLFPTTTERKEAELRGFANEGLSSRPGQDANRKRKQSEDFCDSTLDDVDFLAAESVEIMDIDAFDDEVASLPSRRDDTNQRKSRNLKKQRADSVDEGGEPIQLKNGKWACNHKCKDKAKCKHLCCKEGLDKRPKPSKKPTSSTAVDHLSIASMLEAVNNSSSGQATSAPRKHYTECNEAAWDHALQEQGWSVSRVKEAKGLLTLQGATTPNTTNNTLPAVVSNPKAKRVHVPESSPADGASSVTGGNDFRFNDARNDWEWTDEVSPAEHEAFANSEDKFGAAGEMTGTVDVDKKVRDDDAWLDLDNDDFSIDGNEATLSAASIIGHDGPIQLKQISPGGQNGKNGSRAYASCSSGAAREPSSSRVERLQAKDLSDGDDGIYDLDTENPNNLDPLIPRSVDAGAGEAVLNRSSNNQTVTSSSKKLFFSSRESPRAAAPMDARSENTASGVFAESMPEKTQRRPQVDSVTEEDFTVCKSPRQEEQQKLLMDGIDPSFYDEYKDFVEFI